MIREIKKYDRISKVRTAPDVKSLDGLSQIKSWETQNWFTNSTNLGIGNKDPGICHYKYQSLRNQIVKLREGPPFVIRGNSSRLTSDCIIGFETRSNFQIAEVYYYEKTND